MEVVLEVVVGVVVGLVMGTLGAGGGIISVPALVFLLGQPPAVATTTSLVIIGTTGVFSVVQHGRAGNVAWVDGCAFGVLGAGGALLGSRVATVADPRLTLGLFAVLLVITASVMWHRSRTEERTDPDEREPDRWLTWRPFSVDPRRGVLVLVVASAAGVLTGFFGVGGGFAIVPALTLVLGMPMALAVGTSLLVITLNSVTGVLGRLGTDLHLDWSLIVVFTVAAVLSSLVGGRVGRHVDPALLQRGFAVMLLLVGVYTAASTVLL
ncbi:sulfite exporter TauE/SafE family protein [Ornithinimicrobium avium]|uniref:Probable membrane transporter protein n=1 Tax=Ornithinimicrobium avium TaxID=2283195 RepID=A0A345NR66_9MICO|nr:sulfite exporter TauE/SafE family protein [Ornithinimicrobium avium]AXH97524.1 sulfite exporter TauE/SafE family protein [Ornithinimicrobium avium]